MITNAKGKTVVAESAKNLIAGTAQHLTSTTSVVILGTAYTPAEITTKLQSIVTLRTDVDGAKAATKAKLVTETTDMPALRSFMAAYESYLKGAYGGSPDTLADFGLKPTKARAPATVEAKAAAVAKRAATRAARHTMGSVQKKTVKGDVTGVTLTPITSAPPTVTPPPTPTPVNGGGGGAAPPPAGTTSSGGSAPVTVTTHAS